LRIIRFSKSLEKIIEKLASSDKILYESLLSKIDEIVNSQNFEHYKNLKYGLSSFKRVHIGSFVLLFRHDPSENVIYFVDFDHHDKIYKK